jgi:hypothetical protein
VGEILKEDAHKEKTKTKNDHGRRKVDVEDGDHDERPTSDGSHRDECRCCTYENEFDNQETKIVRQKRI